MTLHCNHCGQDKPEADFPPNEPTRCKECRNRQARERGYHRNRQTIYMARQQPSDGMFPVVRITGRMMAEMAMDYSTAFRILRYLSREQGLSYDPELSIRTWWEGNTFCQQNTIG